MSTHDSYVPSNENHYRDMLDQFRKTESKDQFEAMVMMWMFDSSVSRSDIMWAMHQVEQEKRTKSNE